MNGRGVLLSNSFDVHASFLRVNDAQSLVLTVVQEGQVDLTVDVDTLVDKHRLYGQTFLRCLVSDEVVSNHAFGLFADNLGSLHYVDAALHSRSEVTFSTTTCLHLRFDDEAPLVAESLGDLKRFFGGACKHSLLHVDTVLSHELLGVVLVQIKVSGGHSGECGPHTKGISTQLEGVCQHCVIDFNL